MISQKSDSTNSHHGLDSFGEKIESVADWSDLILPEQQLSALKEIAALVKERKRVSRKKGNPKGNYHEPGICVLFSGKTGTGKILASEVLAKDLKLNLYRIDLSELVNKYIGETEKNLKRIFDAAEDGGAILLFDEADALFAERTNIRDEHDKYINQELSFLLQRIENYKGLVILATNQRNNIDDSLIRRFQAVIHFPMPQPEDSYEI